MSVLRWLDGPEARPIILAALVFLAIVSTVADARRVK